MKLKLYQEVALVRDVLDENLRSGDVAVRIRLCTPSARRRSRGRFGGFQRCGRVSQRSDSARVDHCTAARRSGASRKDALATGLSFSGQSGDSSPLMQVHFASVTAQAPGAFSRFCPLFQPWRRRDNRRLKCPAPLADIVKRKDVAGHGEYRSKRVILEIYDAMQQAMDSGQPYQTRLDPRPADPAVAHSSPPPAWVESG